MMALDGLDLREMTFQNVLDTVLTPAGVKVGGFPQEMFQDLSDSESEQWSCGVCFLIVNDARQCDNNHLFCHTCVFAWSMTYGENSQKCPMCRCNQREYVVNKEVDMLLQDKRVHCQEENCNFKSPLKIFLMHSHGKLKFSNSHVKFDDLRPQQTMGARLLLLPTLGLAGPGANRQQRGTLIRHQLQQGRAMIHQMMTLLNLEMQLRHQSLISYQRAAEPTARVQRLDEALALNEQLSEVGTILSALLSSPMTVAHSSTSDAPQIAGEPPPLYATSQRSGQMPIGRVSNLMQALNAVDDDDSDEDSDSDSSSESSLDLSFSITSQRAANVSHDNTGSVLNRAPVSSLEETLNAGQAALDHARERREISQHILSQSLISDSTSIARESNQPDPVMMGRQPGMIPRVGLNRAQDRPRTLLTSQNDDNTVTSSTSVQRLSAGNTPVIPATTSGPDNVTGTAAAIQTNVIPNSITRQSIRPAANPLPTLSNTTAAHTMHSTTDALSSLSIQRDISRQDTPSPAPSEPTTTGPIPQGSLALRQAMQAISARTETPSSNGSRLSIDVNPSANGSTSRVGQASGSAQRTSLLTNQTTTRQALSVAQATPSNSEGQPSIAVQSHTRGRSPSVYMPNQVTATTQGSSTSHGQTQLGRTAPPIDSQNRPSRIGQNMVTPRNRTIVPPENVTPSDGSVSTTRLTESPSTTPDRHGSILPASLYRRRSRPDSSSLTRSSNTDTHSSIAVQSTTVSRGQTQHATSRTASTGARQKTTFNSEHPSQKQTSPTRRSTLSRRNPLPSRPVINRQISTQSQNSDSGISSLSSESAPIRYNVSTTSRIRPAVARGGNGRASEASRGLPTLPDGHSRPRRRSEIHQNLIMKK